MDVKVCKKAGGKWNPKTEQCIGNKQIRINVWELMNVNTVNDTLDTWLEKDGLPYGCAVDINYECLFIDKDGNLLLKAEYLFDEGSFEGHDFKKRK